jgi:hypothetical protein
MRNYFEEVALLVILAFEQGQLVGEIARCMQVLKSMEHISTKP